MLQWLLPKHNSVMEVYILLMALLLGQTVTNVPSDVMVSVILHESVTIVCNQPGFTVLQWS